MRPSGKRSLHRCSFRSEKNQRTEDKLITLMKKVCCHLSHFSHTQDRERPVHELSSCRQKPSREMEKRSCGNTNTHVRKLHVSTMTSQHATRDPTTTTGLALWSSPTVETRSHPWVPAGHPQNTGAWFARKAVDGPIPPQLTRKQLCTLTW